MEGSRMKYPAYPKYKPSGVEWLDGDGSTSSPQGVPEHWKLKRLKHCFFLKTEKAVTDENPIALENIESWTGRFIETESAFEGDGISFTSGDILFGKLRPYLAKVYLAEKTGESIGDIFVLRPNSQIISKYAAACLRTDNYIKIIDGSTYGSKMPRASWEFMGSLPFLIPTPPEQNAIADFLDRETGRIDALIGKKERLIELLKEKRTALISHAVTKGLNPDVKMKPSGVEWLGDVPEHWAVKKLKYLASTITGFAFSSDDYVDDGIPLIRIGDILANGEIDTENAKKLPEDYLPSYNFVKIVKSDILMAMTGATIGKAGQYTSAEPGLLNQRVCKFLPISIEQRFMWYVLKSDLYSEHIKLTGFGGAQPNISDSQLIDFKITFPPYHEQKAIADILDIETSKIDALVAKVETAIEKLKEYRTALISAAVTGKMDVSTKRNTGVREVA